MYVPAGIWSGRRVRSRRVRTTRPDCRSRVPAARRWSSAASSARSCALRRAAGVARAEPSAATRSRREHEHACGAHRYSRRRCAMPRRAANRGRQPREQHQPAGTSRGRRVVEVSRELGALGVRARALDAVLELGERAFAVPAPVAAATASSYFPPWSSCAHCACWTRYALSVVRIVVLGVAEFVVGTAGADARSPLRYVKRSSNAWPEPRAISVRLSALLASKPSMRTVAIATVLAYGPLRAASPLDRPGRTRRGRASRRSPPTPSRRRAAC